MAVFQSTETSLYVYARVKCPPPRGPCSKVGLVQAGQGGPGSQLEKVEPVICGVSRLALLGGTLGFLGTQLGNGSCYKCLSRVLWGVIWAQSRSSFGGFAPNA